MSFKFSSSIIQLSWLVEIIGCLVLFLFLLRCLQVRNLCVDPSGRLMAASDNLGRVGQANKLQFCNFAISQFPNFLLVLRMHATSLLNTLN